MSLAILHTEEANDPFGTYTVRWFVQPPAEGTVYYVTDEDWNSDYTVRHIYAWAER